jgi:hypothetical protein
MRASLLGISMIVVTYSTAVAACSTEPRGWTRPGSGPIDVINYERDTTICQHEASSFYRIPWIATFVGCMRQRGYIPFYDGILC